MNSKLLQMIDETLALFPTKYKDVLIKPRGRIYHPNSSFSIKGVKHNHDNKLPSSLEMINNPSSIFLINQLDKALMLEDEFKDLFSYPEGYYIQSHVQPLIDDKDLCFFIMDEKEYKVYGKDLDISILIKKKIPLENLNNGINITPFKMKNLRRAPWFPYIGFHLLAIWVIEDILMGCSKIKDINDKKSYICYGKVDKFFENINRGFILENDVKGNIVRKLSSIMNNQRTLDPSDMLEGFEPSDLYIELNRFVMKDPYHIYDVDINSFSINVNKYVDFRIYEWTKMKEGSNE